MLVKILLAAAVVAAPLAFAEKPQVAQTVSTKAPSKLYASEPYSVVGALGCSEAVDGFCSTFEGGKDVLPEGLVLDSTLGYKSKASLKVPKGVKQFLKVDVPAPAFWVRAFMRADAEFAKGHGTFFKTKKSEQEVRVGDHRCQLEINRDGGGGGDYEMTSGSYGENDTVCQQDFGARMKPNTWYCVEAFFNGPESELQVFWDNQNVEQLHVTASRIATNADKRIGDYAAFSKMPWGPHNYDHVEIGYVNYHKDYNRNIWFDDIAVSTARIGCGADYVVNEPLHESTLYKGYEEEELPSRK